MPRPNCASRRRKFRDYLSSSLTRHILVDELPGCESKQRQAAQGARPETGANLWVVGARRKQSIYRFPWGPRPSNMTSLSIARISPGGTRRGGLTRKLPERQRGRRHFSSRSPPRSRVFRGNRQSLSDSERGKMRDEAPEISIGNKPSIMRLRQLPKAIEELRPRGLFLPRGPGRS